MKQCFPYTILKKRMEPIELRFAVRQGCRILMMLISAFVIGGVAHAQTGGPVQREAMGGSPSSGVDDFTGGFSYSIPLLTVPGPNGLSYPIVLSYRSGESPQSGVSWVGYGWSLNPGAIVRDQKGLPDDWSGDIDYYNKVKDVWTVTGRTNLNLEVTSYDFSDTTQTTLPLAGGVSYSSVGRYNDYMGYSQEQSYGAHLKGIGSLTYSVDDDGGHFSGSISPFVILTALNLFHHSNQLSNLYKSLAAVNFLNTDFHVGYNGNEFSGTYPSPTLHFTGLSDNCTSTMTLSAPPYLLGLSWGESGNYTYQHSDEIVTKKAFGYMYSGMAGDTGVMDYHLDKNFPFFKKSSVLPIPVGDVDDFIGTGSAYNGTFRLYSTQVGQFHPTASTSSIDIVQSGYELTGGFRFGAGADFGQGSSVLSVGKWPTAETYNFPGGDGPRDFAMVSGQDLGAGAMYSSIDNAQRASILPIVGMDAWGMVSVHSQVPSIPNTIYQTLNGIGQADRSTLISFTTHGEMNEPTDKGVFYKAYSRDPALRRLVNRRSADGIGEIAITDPGGNRVVYGLPVYSRNESRLSYGLPGLAQNKPDAVHADLLAFTKANTNSGRIVGTVQAKPYAASFLLTEMTTPDYVDRTFNGPTPDDFGGYVKFNYARSAGTPDKRSSLAAQWYRWRAPYRGLMFTNGSLSDPDDDIGTMSSGEREMYYIQSIETKTHIAFFITNVTDTTIGARHIVGSHNALAGRMDAFQAPSDDIAAQDSTASGAVADAQHPNFSRKLERVELYTKNSAGAPDSLLATVFFNYDYSLQRDMPNSLKDPSDTTQRLGMLTLTGLWMQHQNIVTARISPYKFGYHYPDSTRYPKVFRSSHPEIASYGAQYADSVENPSHSEFNVDPWGCYQYNGRARYNSMRNWVNQAPNTTLFDPAAWQLKTIHTPNGGETWVQYEQNDYAYVQDKPASAMVSLLQSAAPGYGSTDDADHAQYYLNLSDVGIPDSSWSRVAKVSNQLKSYFLNENNKIFFKLHYSLLDHANFSRPEYTSDNITGYGNVTVVRMDTIATSPYKRYGVIVEIHGDGDFNVPRKVCRDFVKKNRRGRFSADMEIPDGGSAGDRVAAMSARIKDVDFDESHYCQELDFANSYVRIPLPVAKLGGGIRVKRMLSFDAGTEQDTSIYGTEYIYTQFDSKRSDTISSGVAINEPAGIKDENPLFAPWITADRYPDLASKIIFARDMDQYEGPLAPSLLPAASIGYARVTRRNIHTGESNPGFSVVSFYTAKDYPFVRAYPGIGNSVDLTDVLSSLPQQKSVGMALLHNTIDNIWLSQGYRFIINDMHGKLKSVQSFGGNWSNKDSWNLSSSKEYTYFEPGSPVPVVDSVGGPVSYVSLGKRMDVFMENRQIEDVTNDVNVEGDLTTFIPLDIQPSGFGSVDYTESRFHSHVITKVIRYPAVLKEVLTYGDGVYSSARTAAFDRLTGQPVITETRDGFNAITGLPGETGGHKGLYHAMSFPAYRVYPDLGPKAGSERMLLNLSNPKIAKKILGSGRIVLYHPLISGSSAFKGLTVGDLVVLRTAAGETARGFYHIKKIAGDTVDLLPVSSTFSSPDPTSDSVKVEVIRSGRKNILGAMVGQVATYGLTQQQIDSGTYRTTSGGHVYFSNVLAGSAIVLRDSVQYDTSGIGPTLSDANVYELGQRGRWRTSVAYAYRKSVVAGSKHDLSERVWKRAGIIDTFEVFNWLSPASNSTTTWLRGDSTSLYSYDGMSLESYDPIMIPSSTRFGYNRMLPTVSAYAARKDQIYFNGFEEDSTAAGIVRMVPAHSGEYCLRIIPGATVTIDPTMTWADTASSMSFDLVFRYWRRSGGDTATPRISVVTSIGDTITGTPAKIAQTGEWTLYESVSQKSYSTSHGVMPIVFSIKGTSADTIYIDDLRAGPLGAAMSCAVFDRKTLRPVASFDQDHFGMFPQYDARGTLIRTIVETVEGTKTLAEVHAHIPLDQRDTLGGVGVIARRAPSVEPVSSARNMISFTSGQDGTDGDGHPHADASFDILSFNSGPGQEPSLRVFGIDKSKLDEIVSSDLPSIGLPELPISRKKAIIDSLLALEGEQVASDSASTTADAIGRKATTERGELIRRRKADLLQELGITADEWEQIREGWISPQEQLPSLEGK